MIPLHVVAPVARLTNREKEVVLLVTEGLTIAEAGRRLGVSARTAESHLAHVMRKLGLHRRAEIVRFAIEHEHELAPD